MRIALGVEYDGARFHGWQRQNEVISVQQHLEEALTRIANEPIRVTCAGRTDAGVHATGQVVHFDTTNQRPDRAWTLGVNTYLPATVSVRWAKLVPDNFHARFSATARRYRYIIYNSTLRSGIFANGVSHIYGDLDHDLMHQAAQKLVGKHKEQPVEWVDELLEVKDRTKAGITALPNGLYLVHVTYPEAFELPRLKMGPLFLADDF